MQSQSCQIMSTKANDRHSQRSEEDHGEGMALLPEGFQPGPRDVIIASKGKKFFHHEGNRRLQQQIIPLHAEDYAKCKASRAQKSKIVSSIVAFVRSESPSGGFVKSANGLWYRASDREAHEKVSQTFREYLSDGYKSSYANRKESRKRRHADKDDGRRQSQDLDLQNEDSDTKIQAQAESRSISESLQQDNEMSTSTVSTIVKSQLLDDNASIETSSPFATLTRPMLPDGNQETVFSTGHDDFREASAGSNESKTEEMMQIDGASGTAEKSTCPKADLDHLGDVSALLCAPIIESSRSWENE